MILKEYARLLIERIHDVMWHNNFIDDDVTETDMKDTLMKDVIIQLEEFKKEVEEGRIE